MDSPKANGDCLPRSPATFKDLLEQLGKAHDREISMLTDEIAVLKKEVPPISLKGPTSDPQPLAPNQTASMDEGITTSTTSQEHPPDDAPKQVKTDLKKAWTGDMPKFVTTSESTVLEGATMTEAELEMVQVLFKKFDSDGNGELNKEEFKEMMAELSTQLSITYPADQVEKWFSWSDTDDSGSIDFHEFVQLQTKLVRLNRPVTKGKTKAAVEAQEDANLGRKRSCCVLEPTSGIRLMWDVSGMVLVCYDMVTIPMLSFSPEDNEFTIFMGWLAMLFWTIDILFSISTGFKLPDGTVIMDRRKIINVYVKSWFILDCLVVIPDWTITILELAGGSSGGADVVRMSRMLRALRAIRILRLLRLAKLQKLVTYVYDAIDSEHLFIVVNLVRLILVILLLNHYVACVWYGIGELTRSVGSDTGLNWLEDVGKTPVYETSLGWRYATSLHWSITQFTPASMDVFAVNLVERTFSIVILFWSLVALSSIIGSVSASMTQLRNMTGDRNKQFWLLRRFLKENSIEWGLRERINRYCEHKMAALSARTPATKVSLLATLSEPLKMEVSTAVYSPTLVLHPFYAHLEEFMPKILQRICQEAISQKSMGANDGVFRANEEASNMFFLKSGSFDYTLAGHQAPRKPSLGAAEWICEMVLWVNWRHRGGLVAKEAGELLLADPTTFATVMRRHPRSWHFGRMYGQKICEYVNSQESADITDLTYDDEVSQFAIWSDVYDDFGGQRARKSVLKNSGTGQMKDNGSIESTQSGKMLAMTQGEPPELPCCVPDGEEIPIPTKTKPV